jgi:hypothetical protein
MTVYELSIDSLDATELIFPIREEKEKFVRLVEDKISNGISVKEEWGDFLVLKREPRLKVDFYDVNDSGVTILNTKAYNLISPLLNDSVEVLKLLSDNEDFYLLNVITVTDCFDKENADFSALPSGQIIDVNSFSFCPEKIKCPIFRIPELPYMTLITDDILQIYYLHNLKGLEFTDKEDLWTLE